MQDDLKKLTEELNLRRFLKLKGSKKKDLLTTQIDALSKKNTSLINLNKQYLQKWNEFYNDFRFYEAVYLEYLNPNRLSSYRGKVGNPLSCRSNNLMSSFSTKISSNRNGQRFKTPLSPKKVLEEMMCEYKYNSADELMRKRGGRSNASRVNASNNHNESLLNYNNYIQLNNEREVLSEKCETDIQERFYRNISF